MYFDESILTSCKDFHRDYDEQTITPVDKEKYERFYDRFYNRNFKESRAPLVIDYHIEHSIGKNGFKELWNFYYKKVR